MPVYKMEAIQGKFRGKTRSQKQYRVVESSWLGSGRIEIDIGCEWKPEKKAKEELRELTLKHPGKTFSLQKTGGS